MLNGTFSTVLPVFFHNSICSTCRRDEEQLYHKMNLTELRENASFLDWTRYFNKAFQSVDKTVDAGLQVVNYAPVYLRDA